MEWKREYNHRFNGCKENMKITMSSSIPINLKYKTNRQIPRKI